MATVSDKAFVPSEAVDPSSRNARLELELLVHLAEYNALTMRNTYWITLQYACWPIMILFWGCAAQLWDKVPQTLLIWVCGAVTQAVVASWCEAGHDIYNNATYIEHNLRPKIRSLLQVDQFWGYESFLKGQRGKGPLWYEYWPMVGLVGLLGLTIAYKRPWFLGDSVGAAFYSAVLVIIVRNTMRLVKERKGITCKASA